jgi:hypothetical protein
MSFHGSNIDRAIVMTQYDLRGFLDPLGFRHEHMSGKDLNAITANLVAMAALDQNKTPTDERYVKYGRSSFEEYLSMCKALSEDCDLSQREAIQLIVAEIFKQHKEMKEQVADGTREQDLYLKELNKDSAWGTAMLALAEVFEVEPPTV